MVRLTARANGFEDTFCIVYKLKALFLTWPETNHRYIVGLPYARHVHNNIPRIPNKIWTMPDGPCQPVPARSIITVTTTAPRRVMSIHSLRSVKRSAVILRICSDSRSAGVPHLYVVVVVLPCRQPPSTVLLDSKHQNSNLGYDDLRRPVVVPRLFL